MPVIWGHAWCGRSTVSTRGPGYIFTGQATRQTHAGHSKASGCSSLDWGKGIGRSKGAGVINLDTGVRTRGLKPSLRKLSHSGLYAWVRPLFMHEPYASAFMTCIYLWPVWPVWIYMDLCLWLVWVYDLYDLCGYTFHMNGSGCVGPTVFLGESPYSPYSNTDKCSKAKNFTCPHLASTGTCTPLVHVLHWVV